MRMTAGMGNKQAAERVDWTRSLANGTEAKIGGDEMTWVAAEGAKHEVEC